MIHLSKNHNHCNKLAYNTAKKLESEALEKAKANSSVAPRVILKDLASEMAKAGPSVSAQMTKKSTLARKIRKMRSIEKQRPPIPKSFHDLFEMPEEFKLSTDGSQFLASLEYVDEEQTKAIMLFISAHGKNLLRTFKIIQCDGTFDTCPKPFEQIYFIFACTPRGKAIPAAYALLPNKMTSTYNALFEAIEKACDSNLSHLEAICLDFELALHNVIRERYRDTQILGCLFHQRQAIERQIRFKGLGSLYNNSPTFQEAVALFYALTYVPVDDIEEVFYDYVMEFYERNVDMWDYDFGVRQNLEEFALYLERTYIAKKTMTRGQFRVSPPLFPIPIWNKYDIYASMDNEQETPVTNNAAEAFNSK